VPAGDNENLTPNFNAAGFSGAGKTFWFEPGVHTLGKGQFGQIQAGAHSTYIGGPGAILDGQHVNQSAFSGTATGVKIQHLTIRNFNTLHDQGTVNHDGGTRWTVQYNTMTHNAGAAIFASTNSVVSYNCLKDNGQYGFQTMSSDGTPTHILFDHNEVSGNNAADTENTAGIAGCGCSGGGKFWASRDVTVSNNYVHDNRGTGLWADTNNVGLLFEGNWIENNDGSGIEYEVSYNFAIRNNVLIHNAVADGPHNGGDPISAIYISESGSDSRVTTKHNNFNKTSDISGNLFKDNWSGVMLWENSNRFCSNGLPTVECTLVNPSVITVKSCASALADPARNKPGNSPDYFKDCRWRTRDVKVHDNEFELNPGKVAGCTTKKLCGVNSLYSQYGSSVPYPGALVATNIAFNQGNVFSHNHYKGPWVFRGWAQSNLAYPLSFKDWRGPVTNKCTAPGEVSGGSCNSGFGQDAASTYSR
jgi:Right handed beta helix region